MSQPSAIPEDFDDLVLKCDTIYPSLSQTKVHQPIRVVHTVFSN